MRIGLGLGLSTPALILSSPPAILTEIVGTPALANGTTGTFETNAAGNLLIAAAFRSATTATMTNDLTDYDFEATAASSVYRSSLWSRTSPGSIASFTKSDANFCGGAVFTSEGTLAPGAANAVAGTSVQALPALNFETTDGTSLAFGVINTASGQTGITLPPSIEQVGVNFDGSGSRRAIFFRSSQRAAAPTGNVTVGSGVASGIIVIGMIEIKVS